MHVASPPSALVVFPPLAPGYAWTLTPQGWRPMPYAGPVLVPIPETPPPVAAPAPSPPALAPPSSTPAPSTSAPSSPAPAPTLTADPLADVPPAVIALAARDALVSRALGNLVEARRAQSESLRTVVKTLSRYGRFPRDRIQAIAWVGRLICERPDVAPILRACQATIAESQRAFQALIEAVLPHVTGANHREGPPPVVTAAAPPERAPVCGLDAAQLDAATHLRERDPAVARALDAHTEAMERAHATAATCAAALDRHGPGPNDPAARAARVDALAARDPAVAVALAAALASIEAADRTAAQLAEALAPYTARAPPEHAPSA